MSDFLKLVSMNGKALQGWSKDPDWPGWIPVRSWSFNNGGSGSTGFSHLPLPATEVSMMVNVADLEYASLDEWATHGTTGMAKLNSVPDAVGKQGVSWIFTEANVSSLQNFGSAAEFSIAFSKMEWRYLLRFR